MVDLAPQNPYGLSLLTPVIAAAGSLGYGIEYARQLDLDGRAARRRSAQAEAPGAGWPPLGALVTRSTTLRPRRADPLPRIIETPAGLLYTGMHHNPGLRYVIERCAPVWASWEIPVIVSIAGEDVHDYSQAVMQLEGVDGVAGVEINLPALPRDTLPTTAGQIIAAARAATLLPLLVKLPPDAPDIVALTLAVVTAGADAIALIGGVPGMLVDPATREQIHGWVCGPAIRPLALAHVALVSRAVQVPVIGIGGIATADDARQFLAVGAAAVGVGAALLADPRAAARIAAALRSAG